MNMLLIRTGVLYKKHNML